MSVLGLVVLCVAPFMLAGFRATRGLAPWARVTGTLTPPVLLVGAVLIFLGLTICKEADTLSPSQEVACNTTSALAAPVTAGYVALVIVAWLLALALSRTPFARKVALGLSGTLALAPIALALGLWAYVQI